ncbi:hypothetical protein SAMN02745225_00161 [Ferrithrix thermotolerans DSM 19514]|uniref:Uncharacterized protein n=1 Tax=Ferrithrix thermotolerans DSM 19514 TaxID=1121881 RepID=A0A1M4S7Q9_9ACTN|nr:hypothetical protein SAMN02745225_00161 [Ferrithrix thermotolerans DSM 19514]
MRREPKPAPGRQRNPARGASDDAHYCSLRCNGRSPLLANLDSLEVCEAYCPRWTVMVDPHFKECKAYRSASGHTDPPIALFVGD